MAARQLYVPSYASPHINGLLGASGQLIAAEVRRRTQPPKPKHHYPDISTWARARFYIPSTKAPIVIYPHQEAFLKLAFTRDAQTGHFPFQTILYSTIKQSGKSTMAGVIARWYAEEEGSRSEVYCVGNDLDQAKTRSFREIRYSLELTPGYDANRDRLPGEWEVAKLTMRCLTTGSEIRALAVDAKGEAGGKPSIQCWTEIWGIEYDDALRFWDELTPIPTVPDSMRIVETYAGYEGESQLLYGLYESATKLGHQLSAGELVARTGLPLGTFAEATQPDDPVPIYENRIASQLTYWDSGEAARRMPWQLGPRGDEYYRAQEATLMPNAFARLHRNEWTTSEIAFVPSVAWDACEDKTIPPFVPDDRTPVVLGVDAATSNDTFAIVAVSRHPDPAKRRDEVMVRAVKVFNPKETGGTVDYDEAEQFLRIVCQGSCTGSDATGVFRTHARSTPDPACPACAARSYIPGYNVVQIAFDPYQLTSLTQRLERDQVAWCDPFPQATDRLKADRQLYDLIMTRRIHHTGDPILRQHILSAGARVQKNEDSTMRLVKINQSRKIDAAVALSMAAARCLWLVL